MIKGVDLSQWNNGLTISAVMKAGYKFAILRGGYTGYVSARPKQKDTCFEDYYKQAKAAKMPVGCYWYSCADTKETGIEEANYLYEHCLKGKQFEYPIYIDVEESRWQLNKRARVTAAIIGFCETLTKKGYYCGIYASSSWFDNEIDTAKLTAYTKWVANWRKTKPSFKYNHFDIWQNSSDSNISGYRVDTNICYVDFPALMKSKGYNGFKATETKPSTAKPTTKPTTTKKSVETVAKEVLAGKWGNGTTRKTKLTNAGYNYAEVQKKVNELLNAKSIEKVAREVINGKWGNGASRKNRLTKAGYNYNEVQKKVNELLKKGVK